MISVPSRHSLILMSLGAVRATSIGNGCHLQVTFMSGSSPTIPPHNLWQHLWWLWSQTLQQLFSWGMERSQLPSQSDAGIDLSGLGCWVWFTLSSWTGTTMCLISAYQPSDSSLPGPIVSTPSTAPASSVNGLFFHLGQPSFAILVLPYPHGRLQAIRSSSWQIWMVVFQDWVHKLLQ